MTKSDMQVNAELIDNVLTAKIVEPITGAKYVFYLIRDGEVIERTDWSDKSLYIASLSQSGIFYISAHIKTREATTIINTKPVEYFTKDFNERYIGFLNKPRHIDSFDINFPFIPNKYPFYDFVIICEKNENELPSFGLSASLLPEAGEWKRVLMTNADFSAPRLFSGMMTYNDRFIYGDKDARYLPRNLSGYTGCFSCMQINESVIQVYTDYFNFCHLFYYIGEDIIIVSNRYHALLLCAAPYYANSGLNVEKAAVLLTSHRLPTMLHNFTFEMDIQGCFQLPAYYNINLTDAGISFEENEFYRDLIKEYQYSPGAYKLLLEAGKNDIIRDINAVFNDSRVKHFKVDLSGGMDSRTVYAALRHVKNKGKKIQINTYNSGKEDIAIATHINRLYGYPYDTLPETHINKTIYAADHMMRSFFIGVNYEHNPSTFYNDMDKVITLSGAGGDIVIRSFYARQYLSEDFADIGDCVDYLENQYAPFIRGSDRAYQAFNELFLQTLSQIPVRSVFQKLDMIWLMLGNGFHFFSEFKNATGNTDYSVLMSKNLFRAKLMSLDTHKDARMHHHVIERLDKTLAGIPYDKDINNSFNNDQDSKYKNLKIKLIRFAGKLLGKNISKTWEDHLSNLSLDKKARKEYLIQRCDASAWEENVKQKSEYTRFVYPDALDAQINWQLKQYQDILYESLFNNLILLYRQSPELERLCGKALYHYALLNKDYTQSIRILYNKVTSLLDQTRVIRRINKDTQIKSDLDRNLVYCVYSASRSIKTEVIDSNTLRLSISLKEKTSAYAQLFDNVFDKAPSAKFFDMAKLHANRFELCFDVITEINGVLTIFFMEYEEEDRVSNRSDIFKLSSGKGQIILEKEILPQAKLFKLAFLLQFDKDTVVEFSDIKITQKDKK